MIMTSKQITLSPAILKSIEIVEKKEQLHIDNAQKKAGRDLSPEEKEILIVQYYYKDYVNNISKKCMYTRLSAAYADAVTDTAAANEEVPNNDAFADAPANEVPNNGVAATAN